MTPQQFIEQAREHYENKMEEEEIRLNIETVHVEFHSSGAVHSLFKDSNIWPLLSATTDCKITPYSNGDFCMLIVSRNEIPDPAAFFELWYVIDILNEMSEETALSHLVEYTGLHKLEVSQEALDEMEREKSIDELLTNLSKAEEESAPA